MEKIIYLEQQGEDDIPIPIVYERLPEFCFCCGLIGHQYKECDKYKGQPKDKLAYGVWIQAVQLVGKLRTNRTNERGQNSSSKHVNLPIKTRYKDHRGNSSPQQLVQLNRANITRMESS